MLGVRPSIFICFTSFQSHWCHSLTICYFRFTDINFLLSNECLFCGSLFSMYLLVYVLRCIVIIEPISINRTSFIEQYLNGLQNKNKKKKYVETKNFTYFNRNIKMVGYIKKLCFVLFDFFFVSPMAVQFTQFGSSFLDQFLFWLLFLLIFFFFSFIFSYSVVLYVANCDYSKPKLISLLSFLIRSICWHFNINIDSIPFNWTYK